MSIIRRDKTTIRDLVSQLSELDTRLQALQDSDHLTVEDRALLDHITATVAVDLDQVVTKERLASNISDLESDTLAASVTAIREYVLGALQMGGPSCTIESLPVSGGKITLTYRPHSGLGGVLNFGMVRCVINSEIHQFKLTTTSDPYRFVVESGGIDINGYSAEVQYLYHYDVRDLNDLIGEMILDGLLLMTPESSGS